jgi:hypothetical protein
MVGREGHRAAMLAAPPLRFQFLNSEILPAEAPTDERIKDLPLFLNNIKDSAAVARKL